MKPCKQVKLYEIYRFLAQAMRYPEVEWFDQSFLTFYTSLLSELNFQEKGQFISEFSAQFLETIQVEHTRLFINGVPHVAAPPYASMYLNGTLNGPVTERTFQYYAEYGYTFQDNDFPDHIVTELDFVAWVEQTKSGSSEEFLEELFRPWFNSFKEKVLSESTLNYYQTTVELIDFFTCPEVDN